MAACQVTPAQLPIDILIDQIKAEFVKSETPSPDTIKGLLSTYITAGHQDWREFALFNSIKYSRNLLEFNENFELIVLCWLPGQESPIHNHSVRKTLFSCLLTFSLPFKTTLYPLHCFLAGFNPLNKMLLLVISSSLLMASETLFCYLAKVESKKSEGLFFVPDNWNNVPADVAGSFSKLFDTLLPS